MRRNTKIIATIGPGTASDIMLESLFQAGANTFRLNMSHLTHESVTQVCHSIRTLEKKCSTSIGILVDLQGPKIRLGEVSEGVVLCEGDSFTLDLLETAGTAERAPLPHPEVFQAVQVGQKLLLDDGKICLQVTSCGNSTLVTQVKVGGALKSRKGINLPETILPVSVLTPKDRADLTHALSCGVDWIALSFVQKAQDIEELRSIVGERAYIMAKIEKPQAVLDLDAIIQKADGVMIARGDLGVELPLEMVPSIQKRIILAARQAGRPVVVATQMLESMIHQPTPTRAEVSDVAQAVFEGADAVMLSAETATGSYPCEAVAIMDKIAKEVEADANYSKLLSSVSPTYEKVDALCCACHTITDHLKIVMIVCYTNSGKTGLSMARWRPRLPILALTHIKETARRLSLVWGITTVFATDPKDLEDVIEKASQLALSSGKAKKGDMIAVMAGIPIGTPQATNLLRVVDL